MAAETHRNGSGSGPKTEPDETAAWERHCIARTRAGDTEAFGDLVEAYSARVYTYLFRLVRHREEAEDLTQETFLRAFRFLWRFDASRQFRTWLFAIATNVGLNALRAKRREGVLISIDDDTECTTSVKIADARENARQRMARGDLEKLVTEAVKRLPPRPALLVSLHYQEGMPIREAAEAVGLSEGAAKVALCRARRRLREWLVENIQE